MLASLGFVFDSPWFRITQGLILDRATGREVTLDQLWRGLTPASQVALHLAHPAPDLDPQRRDVLTQGGLAFTAHLSPANLNLTPTTLANVLSACGATVVIPCAELRAQADTRLPYFRELYPRSGRRSGQRTPPP